MILYCTLNRGTELWYLDLAGRQARPPVAPAVYALVSFEGACPRYYVGSSKRLTARLGAHLSFARSTKLRGHSAGGRLLAPRSEEHTSELQSLMRISYAVFCL